MVLKLRLVGSGKEPFYRDFDIREDQTFYDLHIAIQDELSYDKSQLASFFLADNNWEKGLEINVFDMTDDTFTPVILMDRTQLCELLYKEGQRLLYVFDFFSNRFFFINLLSVTHEEINKTYPRCTSGKGSPPKQITIKDPDLPDIRI